MQQGLIGFSQEYLEVLENVKKLEKKSAKINGRPKVKCIIFDIFSNMKNLIYNPSIVNFVTIFIDYSSYIIMPLEGGYFAANAHDKYNMDKFAYMDAGVTEEFIFLETTNLFKEKFWQFFGMFDRVSQTTGIDYGEEDGSGEED